VVAGLVVDAVDVVVLVDDHHREVPLAAVRESERRPCGQVDHGRGVERVPVLPDDGLLVQWRGLAEVVQAVDPAGLSFEGSEHPSRLGTAEAVDVHRLVGHAANLLAAARGVVTRVG
jgi:hypothetical protein